MRRDSNLRLVADEDDNGKFRLVRVKWRKGMRTKRAPELESEECSCCQLKIYPF